MENSTLTVREFLSALKAVSPNYDVEKELMEAAAISGNAKSPERLAASPVSRVLAAFFTARFVISCDIQIPSTLNMPVPPVDDAEIPDWAKAHIMLCRTTALIPAFEDGSFRPNEPFYLQETDAVIRKLLLY